MNFAHLDDRGDLLSLGLAVAPSASDRAAHTNRLQRLEGCIQYGRDLRIPGVLYESLSIFLLLAIGLKGGVELARYPLATVALPALVVVAVGALIPLVAYPVLLTCPVSLDQ